MGGVIIILTRGMGERLTYGIPARYHVVLMERLGGLLFDGGRSCVRDSFRWSFRSVPLRVSRGEYTFFAGRELGYARLIVTLVPLFRSNLPCKLPMHST